MIALKWTATLVVCGYVVLVAVLYLGQRHLLFLPPAKTIHPTPAEVGWPEAQELTLKTADGQHVVVWQVAPPAGRPVVVYFHGNGEIVPWRADRHRRIAAAGNGVVALSYRGYMGSTGRPSEDGLVQDAEAALRFAAEHYPQSPLFLWGHSLGSGVAVALAARHQVAGVILEAPYSSTVDVAAMRFPIVPVRWLMLDQFHSDERIAAVKAPLLIMHGENDDVIPIGLAERLFKLANNPKRFVRFPGGHHIDLDDFGATGEALSFIAGALPR